MIVIYRKPLAVFIFNRRVHHGLAGLALAAFGLFLTLEDWSDRPWTPYRNTR